MAKINGKGDDGNRTEQRPIRVNTAIAAHPFGLLTGQAALDELVRERHGEALDANAAALTTILNNFLARVRTTRGNRMLTEAGQFDAIQKAGLEALKLSGQETTTRGGALSEQLKAYRVPERLPILPERAKARGIDAGVLVHLYVEIRGQLRRLGEADALSALMKAAKGGDTDLVAAAIGADVHEIARPKLPPVTTEGEDTIEKLTKLWVESQIPPEARALLDTVHWIDWNAKQVAQTVSKELGQVAAVSQSELERLAAQA